MYLLSGFRLGDHVADKTKQPILIFPEGLYLNVKMALLFSAAFPVLLKIVTMWHHQELASTTHR